MACAEIPERNGESEKSSGDDRNQRSVLRRDAAAEETHARIERGEPEGNNPAKEKLDGAAVNRKRPAAESDQVPDRRMDADAVFPEEGEGAENRENGDVDDARAEAVENEPGNLGKRPVNAEAMPCPSHAEKAGGNLVQRFDAEIFEQDLKERGNWAQEDAVEFSFDDVVVSEIVEVEANDIEQAVGNQREAPEKENFFEAPAGQLGRIAKKHDHKSQGENGSGKTGGQADEEIAAITDADFGVLREVVEEEEGVAAEGGEKAGCPGL